MWRKKGSFMNSSMGTRLTEAIRPFFTKHWGGCITVVGVVHLLIGAYLGAYTALPERLGVETLGTLIEKKTVRRIARKDVLFLAEYNFIDSTGTLRTGERTVDKGLYRDIEKGDRVQVNYLSWFPSIHTVQGNSGKTRWKPILGLGVGITVFALFIFLFELRKIRDNEPDHLLVKKKTT